MPTWRSDLPPEGQHKGFDLKRTPAAGALLAIVTCESFVVVDTHFWHGRTSPCERILDDKGKTFDDTPCLPCVEKVGYRTHVYVSSFDSKKREHFIFECTSHAAKAFDDYQKANGTLRGCIFNATRPKGTRNSKVDIQTSSANLAKYTLPGAPDVIMALAVIWRLPLPALDVSHESNGNKKVLANASRMRNVRNQPANAGDPVLIGDLLQGNGHRKKRAHVI